MEKPNIVIIARDFLSGELDTKELADIIEERLFELRQSPGLTNEQEALSVLELIIHEAMEGYRNWDEVDEYLFSVLENDTSEHFVTTITLNSSASSEFNTVSRAIPAVEYHQEFTLA